MKKNILYFLLLALMFSFSSCDKKPVSSEVNIIPRPSNFFMGDSYFKFKSNTKIVLQFETEELRMLSDYLAVMFRKMSGFEVPVVLYDDAREVNGDIILSVTGRESRKDEAYSLDFKGGNFVVESKTGKGVFYGIQSLLQLIPMEVRYGENQGSFEIPGIRITDSPRFEYRGMHLDVSRHFFPKEFIYKFIDIMATYKFNTFHWHLTDDNGWRLEIKKYPLLTDVAAWRVDREAFPWREREAQKPGEEATYGGFYTQEEVKEIIKYAQERYITIIPEIEMPGHVSEVFAAYPELSCAGKKIPVNPGSYWPNSDIFCAGKEETFEFLEGVLDEVIELFPSEYIHIGGDEATKTEWEKCKLCQARMKKEGLKNEHELQSYFIKRIEKYVLSKGKKIIGWDEILEGGLAPEATVMSWRGMEGGIEAAEQGHDVIMTPVSHCYFDYYQADRDFEPVAIGGFTSLKKVYSFEPIPPELSEEEAKHILGAQGNIWTEYIATPEHAEYMAIPRMIALAEVVWSTKNKRNFDHFNKRLQSHFKRFDLQNINYSKGSYKVEIIPETDTATGQTKVKLESEIWEAKIHYTTDGNEPDTSSNLYIDPVKIDKSTTIKAGIFIDGKLQEKVSQQELIFHKAMGKKINLKTPYSNRYTAGGDDGIVDGILGGVVHNNGLWQGFQGEDLEAVIDLGANTEFKKIEIGFYQRQASWIFFPEYVEFYVSDDGTDFKKRNKIITDVSLKDKKAQRKTYAIISSETHKARYVKVIAKNIGVCPSWHMGAGDKAWIFADEIIVD